MGLILACPSGGTGSTPEVKQTPKASDYIITGTNVNVVQGDPINVTVTPKEGASPGAITIKYTGSTGTTPSKPTEIGGYSVTFDVAAAPGWEKGEDLAAGFVNIGRPGALWPERDDFIVTGFPVDIKAGQPHTPISITAKPNKSQGAITITYENTVTGIKTTSGPTGGVGFPTIVGLYSASFNVAEDLAHGYNEVSGLVAGTVYIADPESSATLRDPKWEDFEISIGDEFPKTFTSDNNSSSPVTIEYNEAIQRVKVKPLTGYPEGNAFMNFTYFKVNNDGSLEPRFDASDVTGKYKVVIDFTGYVGTTVVWTTGKFNLFYNIDPRKPRPTDYVITGLIQAEAGKALQEMDRAVNHVRIVRKPTYEYETDAATDIQTIKQKDGKDVVAKAGIASKGKITVYYEKISTDGKWDDKDKAIAEKFFGWDGTRTITTSSDYTVYPQIPTAEQIKPPQDAGLYRVTFKVDKPNKEYNLDPNFPESKPWVKANEKDVENWAESEGRLDGGIFELRKLVPLYPEFVNLWIDNDDKVVQIKATNDQKYMLPNESIIFNFTGDGTVTEWRVDGSTVATSGNSFTFTSKAMGAHNVTVLVSYKHPAASEAKIFNAKFKVLVVDKRPDA